MIDNPVLLTVSTATIDWDALFIGLFGGLALFLYGMAKMSEAMKKAAGRRMRSILAALTRNRVIGMGVGAFVTMVIQSSSATTVMLVSFVQAELMSFAQSLSVIMGANIGTTVTAQIIAFKVTDYALLMVAVGFAMTFLSRRDTLRYIGEAILGFGILFFGMKLMSDTMKPLREFQPFIDTMMEMENPFLALMVGALFTGLIQSSSAFTGIVIVLAQQGFLTLEAGIPLIFGANVGTCVTAGLASIGTIRGAKRVAIAHVLFNVGGVLLFIWFIPHLAELVRSTSPTGNSLAVDTPRQIANAHSIFNISVGLIFLPFTVLMAKLVYRILPDREREKGVVPKVWFLDNSQIDHPAVAIGLAQTEMNRMIKILARMLEAALTPFVAEAPERDAIYPHLSLREGIQMREDKIDYLEGKVTSYLTQVSRGNVSTEQAELIFAMMSIANDFESIGDIVNRNVVHLAEKKKILKVDFSEVGKRELATSQIKVKKQVSRLREAFATQDLVMARKVIRKDLKYRDLYDDYRQSHLERLRGEVKESISTHEIHMEMMDLLKQINIILANVAKTIVEIRVDSENAEEESE